MERRSLVLAALAFSLASCRSKDAATPRPDAANDGGIGGVEAGAGTGTGDPVTQPIAPGPPRVSYLGRIDASDPAGPRVAWSGTQIVVRFEGTAFSVTLSEAEDTDGGSRYDVAIDGVAAAEPFAPEEGTKTYEIATGLTSGTHVVVLTRRTEPQVGVTQFLSFVFPDGGKLLAPPSAPSRRVELLGDSEMTGYGVECGGPDESFSAATENAAKAYPALVAKSLGAEVRNLGFSGKGVYRNDSPGPLYGTYYPQAVPRYDPTSYDFSSWKADVLWIALGANDYSPNGGPPDVDAFGRAYRDLVDLAREKNGDAHIVLAVPSAVNDFYPEGFAARTNIRNVMKSIVAQRRAAGDAKVHLAEMPEAREADLSGCDSHPSAALHAALAPVVAGKIREITGWK